MAQTRYSQSGRATDMLTVTTTAQAAQILLNRWPTRRGKALEKAKMICVKVIEGRKTPEKARKAFVKAARKAGLRLRHS